MSEVRVAFAAPDRGAALDLVERLQTLGYRASAALLAAGRAVDQPAPTVLVWSRYAAAEPRLRALSRFEKAPLLVRLDASPAPWAARARLVDARDAAGLASALGPKAKITPQTPRQVRTQSHVAAPVAAAPAPAAVQPAARKGGALGWLLAGFGLMTAAAGAAAAAWYFGYLPL
jgi:hypothetical protein